MLVAVDEVLQLQEGKVTHFLRCGAEVVQGVGWAEKMKRAWLTNAFGPAATALRGWPGGLPPGAVAPSLP